MDSQAFVAQQRERQDESSANQHPRPAIDEGDHRHEPTPTNTGGSPAVPSVRNVKIRQHLQLPPFRSLGIAAPHPDVLLTPPDEQALLFWDSSEQRSFYLPNSLPSRHPIGMTSEGTTPETPLLSEFISAAEPEAPTASQPTASHPSAVGTGAVLEGVGESSTTNIRSNTTDEGSVWIRGALEVVGKYPD